MDFKSLKSVFMDQYVEIPVVHIYIMSHQDFSTQ